jgi:hypothetical protein
VQVRASVAALLPRLQNASQKYVALLLDKRRTLVLPHKDPSAAISSLPQAPDATLDNAAGAPLQCSAPHKQHLMPSTLFSAALLCVSDGCLTVRAAPVHGVAA